MEPDDTQGPTEPTAPATPPGDTITMTRAEFRTAVSAAVKAAVEERLRRVKTEPNPEAAAELAAAREKIEALEGANKSAIQLATERAEKLAQAIKDLDAKAKAREAELTSRYHLRLIEQEASKFAAKAGLKGSLFFAEVTAKLLQVDPADESVYGEDPDTGARLTAEARLEKFLADPDASDTFTRTPRQGTNDKRPGAPRTPEPPVDWRKDKAGMKRAASDDLARMRNKPDYTPTDHAAIAAGKP